MSLFFGGSEKRIFDASRWAIPPNSQAGTGGSSINLTAAESSLQKVAIWSSVMLLAGTAGMLPLDGFTGKGKTRREIGLPAWMEDPAGDNYGYGDWAQQLVTSLLLRGNAAGAIVSRDGRGLPDQIVLQHPDMVGVRRDSQSGLPVWRFNGTEMKTNEVWHQRAYPMPGQLLGLSPVAHHATTIGLGLSVLRFGNQWFSDGAHPTGILKTTAPLKEEPAKVAKARFMAAVAGRREPLVLSGDWDFKPIQIAPEESQFLETNKMTSAECARIYGPGVAEILGYETGGSMTYANVEQQALHLLVYALDPWLTRIDRAFTALLPPGQYARVNRGALLRTDILTRYRAHQLAIRNGFQTPSEARELEDMPPLTPEQLKEFENLPSTSGTGTDTGEGGTK